MSSEEEYDGSKKLIEDLTEASKEPSIPWSEAVNDLKLPGK